MLCIGQADAYVIQENTANSMVVRSRVGHMEHHRMSIVRFLLAVTARALGIHLTRGEQVGAIMLKMEKRGPKILLRKGVPRVLAVLINVPVRMVSQRQVVLVRVMGRTNVLRATTVISWTATNVKCAKQENTSLVLTNTLLLLAKIVLPADTQQRVQKPATNASRVDTRMQARGRPTPQRARRVSRESTRMRAKDRPTSRRAKRVLQEITRMYLVPRHAKRVLRECTRMRAKDKPTSPHVKLVSRESTLMRVKDKPTSRRAKLVSWESTLMRAKDKPTSRRAKLVSRECTRMRAKDKPTSRHAKLVSRESTLMRVKDKPMSRRAKRVSRESTLMQAKDKPTSRHV